MNTPTAEDSRREAVSSPEHQALARRMRGVRFARLRSRLAWFEPSGPHDECRRISFFAFRQL